jgi:UV DNA damage endonuclease
MIGKYIHNNTLRISMHPDRFVLLNTPNDDVLQRSVTDFRYQVAVLNLFGLDASAKIQIHVRDVYGDKKIVRTGSSKITLRSILPSGGGSFENDERLYTVANCCALHERTGVPVLFDVFHHSVHNNGEKIPDIMDLVFTT